MALTELDSRESDGITVALLYDRDLDRVYLAVDDSKCADSFTLDIPKEKAMDAFLHPFAYRAVA